MFQKVKSLSARIYSGFGVVLLLLIIVAVAGYSTLTGLAHRVGRASDMNMIVRDIFIARQNEDNYIMRRDSSYVKNVTETVEDLKNLANTAKTKFKQNGNKRLMDQINGEVDKYSKAFDAYVSLSAQRSAADKRMGELSDAVLKEINDIYHDQKSSVNELLEKSEQFVSVKMNHVQDANDVWKLYLEVARQRAALMKQCNEESVEYWKNIITLIVELSLRLKSELTQEQDIQQADLLAANIVSFQDIFLRYIELQDQSDIETFTASGNAAIKALEILWNSQMSQFKNAQVEYSGIISDKIQKADNAKQLIEWFLEVIKNEKELVVLGDRKFFDFAQTGIGKILTQANDLKSKLKSAENIKNCEQAIEMVKTYQTEFEKYLALMEQQNLQEKVLNETAKEVQNIGDKARSDQKIQMEKEIDSAKHRIIIWSVLAIAAGCVFAFLLIWRITKSLQPVIDGLMENAQQLTSAASQISSGSHSLAEGASQQAASVEETSSSLETMSSMTKANANHSDQAAILMREVNQVIEKANGTMKDLTGSMEDIIKSSREISKIVKTIDEIAFQTNLLALNAAVEAARAGQSGAGFAVVADEVRNLAMRSTKAARDTSLQIESTVKKISGGAKLVTMTSQAFSEVAESASKVSELVAEISTASNEQAQGIAQLNMSVIEMEKVIQQNAAHAEESAAASEQLFSHAQGLKDAVYNVASLIRGSTGTQGNLLHKPDKEFDFDLHEKTKPLKQPELPIPNFTSSSELRPEQVIPLDEDDLKEF